MSSAVSPDNWPPPSYAAGPKEHIQALGVVAATYNHLEFTLFVRFRLYLGVSVEIAQHLLAMLTNNSRLDMLRNGIEQTETDAQVKDLALYFAKGYDICSKNRNFMVHSSIRTSAQMKNSSY